MLSLSGKKISLRLRGPLWFLPGSKEKTIQFSSSTMPKAGGWIFPRQLRLKKMVESILLLDNYQADSCSSSSTQVGQAGQVARLNTALFSTILKPGMKMGSPTWTRSLRYYKTRNSAKQQLLYSAQRQVYMLMLKEKQICSQPLRFQFRLAIQSQMRCLPQ